MTTETMLNIKPQPHRILVFLNSINLATHQGEKKEEKRVNEMEAQISSIRYVLEVADVLIRETVELKCFGNNGKVYDDVNSNATNQDVPKNKAKTVFASFIVDTLFASIYILSAFFNDFNHRSVVKKICQLTFM